MSSTTTSATLTSIIHNVAKQRKHLEYVTATCIEFTPTAETLERYFQGDAGHCRQIGYFATLRRSSDPFDAIWVIRTKTGEYRLPTERELKALNLTASFWKAN
jgi:hypothetical protein